jgi:hypothetical protein
MVALSNTVHRPNSTRTPWPPIECLMIVSVPERPAVNR